MGVPFTHINPTQTRPTFLGLPYNSAFEEFCTFINQDVEQDFRLLIRC